jgi:hypothetical protein
MVVTGEQSDQCKQNSCDDGNPALSIESRKHRSHCKRTFSLMAARVFRNPCNPPTFGTSEAESLKATALRPWPGKQESPTY